MKIGKVGGQNAGLHISAMNQSIAHKNEAMTGRKQEDEKEDGKETVVLMHSD